MNNSDLVLSADGSALVHAMTRLINIVSFSVLTITLTWIAVYLHAQW